MTTPRQGRALAAGLPAFSIVLRQRYTVNERSAERSLLKIRAAMTLIGG